MPRERFDSMDGTDARRNTVAVTWGKANLDHRGIQLGHASVGISVETLVATSVPVAHRIDGALEVVLDRQRLNDLIRVLRRARDQAFGADA